jgi:hypothetical protein
MERFDAVIEAVRYKGGKIVLVRAYERRGPTFSDRVLLDRATLLAQIRQGRRFVTGQRKKLLAGSFDVGMPITLSGPAGSRVLTTRASHAQDRLDGVPVF